VMIGSQQALRVHRDLVIEEPLGEGESGVTLSHGSKTDP